MSGHPPEGSPGKKRLFHGRRVITPTMLQMEATECGAASLGIVLAYHGRYVPLEKLREQCGVSRDGSKASNIVRVAREYGLTAKGYKKEPEELCDLPLPMILFWNFNHFLVLEGIKGATVYLNDPAKGPRTVTRKELDESFTGLALLFEKTEQFKPGGEKPGIFKALSKRLPAVRTGFSFAVIAGLGLVIPGLLIPTGIKIFVDDILIGQKGEWLKPLLLALSLTGLLQGALFWLQQHCLLRQQTKLAVTSSSRFLNHILNLPVVFFTQRYAGEIGSRVMINDRVAMLLSGELATTALSLLSIIFFAAVMACYDVMLTLITIAITSLNVVALIYISRRRVDLSQRCLSERGRLVGESMGGLQMIETLKSTGTESDFFVRWSGCQAKLNNAMQELHRWSTVVTPLPPMLTMLATVMTLGIGGIKVMNGEMTMGALTAFQTLMMSFMMPVNQVVALTERFQQAVADMNRLDDVFNYDEDNRFSAPAGTGSDRYTALSGQVELKNISFGYSRMEPPLLNDFSLTLPPGARVALVGTSGSGKTTVARLICGLYQPWTGEILFDGAPRSALPRMALTTSLSYVDQDIYLFEGTVRANLTLWNSVLPDSDILQAARDACIHEDISIRGGGYESMVAERGANFSGGQRQRLEIARALVTKPSILVLDEATSALDPETEMLIDENLRRRGCTCIIIAHRLSTIRDCDEIIVMNKGRVAQRGTHDELMQQGGLYQWLIES